MPEHNNSKPAGQLEGVASEASSEDPEYLAPRLKLTLADFELLRRIGDGSYSQVVLARHRTTGNEYALKVIDKHYIVRHKVVEYIRRERSLLDGLRHEGIARLAFTFQDAFSLYMGLEYCPNGELYDQIRLQGRLTDVAARIYAAEVIQVLEYLRSQRVVHRDLKPENLLLDARGHLKLIDFGSAKRLAESDALAPTPAEGEPAMAAQQPPTALSQGTEAGPHVREQGQQQQQQQPAAGQQRPQQVQEQRGSREHEQRGSSGSGGSGRVDSEDESTPEGLGAGRKRAVSLVGTADYVSPEVLSSAGLSCATDLWALGCVVFQMLVGRPPFKSPSEYLTFQRIAAADYALPPDLPAAAADLIARLLVVEPGARLGARDLGELRRHAFFAGVAWEGLRAGEAPAFAAVETESVGSASSSFDWELQSLASALPKISSKDPLPDVEDE